MAPERAQALRLAATLLTRSASESTPAFTDVEIGVVVDGETIVDASAASFTASVAVSDEIGARTTSAFVAIIVIVAVVIVILVVVVFVVVVVVVVAVGDGEDRRRLRRFDFFLFVSANRLLPRLSTRFTTSILEM